MRFSYTVQHRPYWSSSASSWTAHGLTAIPLQSNIQWNTCDTHGQSIKFLVLPVWVDAYHFSFFPATVTLWNNLPTDVVLSSSVDSFENRVAAVQRTASTEFYNFLFLNCTDFVTVPPDVFNYCYSCVVCTCSLLTVPVLCSCSGFMFLPVWSTFSGYACAPWPMHDDTHQWGYVHYRQRRTTCKQRSASCWNSVI